MKSPIWILGPAICLFLAGCCTQTATLQPIDRSAIAAVQAEIKRQVGVYLAAADRKSGEIHELATQNQFECGVGDINFAVSNIKAELTTTTDVASDVKAGASIPGLPFTLGPSLENKTDLSNTEVLDYNLWLMPRASQNEEIFSQDVSTELQTAPIAKVLLDLRDALIQSATKSARGPQPCFTDYDPQKPAGDAGNSFKLGLSFTKDTTGGVSIGVSVITLSGTGEAKSVTGNTLTVAFVQADMDQIQYLKDGVDAECKYPNAQSTKCLAARAKLAAEVNKGRGESFR